MVRVLGGEVDGERQTEGGHSCIGSYGMYCTISTKCSRCWEIFHAEMAEIFSFDLRRIKKNTFFFDMTHDVNIWSK